MELPGTDATEIPSVLAKAFFIAASGRPGPVLIDITKMHTSEFDFEGYTKFDYIRSFRPKPFIRNEYIEQAAELIICCNYVVPQNKKALKTSDLQGFLLFICGPDGTRTNSAE